MSYHVIIQPVEPQHKTFEGNITYNLMPMLKLAGFHPQIMNGLTAEQARPMAQNAWKVLYENTTYFEKYEHDPPEFGSYTQGLLFLAGLSDYLRCCPDDFIVTVA